MAEYIEKEAAIMAAMNYDGDGNGQDASQDIAGAIGDIPAANVRENVKAHWYDVGSLSCRCSACGCKNNRETPFCPNCGADMRGGDDGK